MKSIERNPPVMLSPNNIDKKLVVRQSNIHASGLGLFTKIMIKAGTYIDEYTGRKRLQCEDVENVNDEYTWDLKDVYDKYGNQMVVDATKPMGTEKKKENKLRYVNAAIDKSRAEENGLDLSQIEYFANMYPLTHRNEQKLYYIAARDIEPNEELLVDYGAKYWEGKEDMILQSQPELLGQKSLQKGYKPTEQKYYEPLEEEEEYNEPTEQKYDKPLESYNEPTEESYNEPTEEQESYNEPTEQDQEGENGQFYPVLNQIESRYVPTNPRLAYILAKRIRAVLAYNYLVFGRFDPPMAQFHLNGEDDICLVSERYGDNQLYRTETVRVLKGDVAEVSIRISNAGLFLTLYLNNNNNDVNKHLYFYDLLVNNSYSPCVLVPGIHYTCSTAVIYEKTQNKYIADFLLRKAQKNVTVFTSEGHIGSVLAYQWTRLDKILQLFAIMVFTCVAMDRLTSEQHGDPIMENWVLVPMTELQYYRIQDDVFKFDLEFIPCLTNFPINPSTSSSSSSSSQQPDLHTMLDDFNKHFLGYNEVVKSLKNSFHDDELRELLKNYKTTTVNVPQWVLPSF